MDKETVKISCTWKDKIDCADCNVEELLNCRFDKKKWLFFVFNQMPARFFAIFGLVLTGLLYRWWPLIVFGAIASFFIIFGIEIRVVCTHCPFYSSESKILRCYGLTGSLKLWKYHPGPMKFWEKAVETIYFLFMLCWPVAFESYLISLIAVNYSSYGLYSLLGMIAILSATIISSLQFAYILRVVFCSKCINFSCPINKVPKKIVDTYLAKNLVMREAWEKAGYKLGDEK